MINGKVDGQCHDVGNWQEYFSGAGGAAFVKDVVGVLRDMSDEKWRSMVESLSDAL